MAKADLLLEVGTEEIPAGYIDGALAKLAAGLTGWLAEKGFAGLCNGRERPQERHGCKGGFTDNRERHLESTHRGPCFPAVNQHPAILADRPPASPSNPCPAGQRRRRSVRDVAVTGTGAAAQGKVVPAVLWDDDFHRRGDRHYRIKTPLI